MFAVSASLSGAAFLGKATALRAKAAAPRGAARGPVTTQAFFGFGGGPKQVRGEAEDRESNVIPQSTTARSESKERGAAHDAFSATVALDVPRSFSCSNRRRRPASVHLHRHVER